MRFVVDAFGGDNAPLEIIKGSILAIEEYGCQIVLVGNEEQLNDCFEKNNLSKHNIKIVNATGSPIDMCDDAKAVIKHKSDSSMAVAFKELIDGNGDALISAGNTGALTVGATLLVKRIKGVKRPCIASIMPSQKKPFLLLDCGANVECRPEFLEQFGELGSIYMEKILHYTSPKVALVNNGTEETKGTELIKESYQLMKKANYNFIGNIEARQIAFGDADVVVADGFSGNLILKMYEGVAKSLLGGIKNIFKKNLISKLSAVMVMPGINEMKKQFDYKEYGGAVILGVKKPVIKAHGSADAKTFKNAIKQAKWCLDNDLISELEKAFVKENEQ